MCIRCPTILAVALVVAFQAASPPPARAGQCGGGGPVVAAGCRFDYRTIDRTLKEPKYGSARPAYRFLAFGPEGEYVVAMVADESKGTGRGVDVLYLDLNANHDIAEPAERFALKRPRPMKKLPGGRGDLVLIRLTAWGETLVPSRRLPVPDPKLRYLLSVANNSLLVRGGLAPAYSSTSTASGPGATPPGRWTSR